MKKICIVDYGLGNIKSVEKSLNIISDLGKNKTKVIVSKNPKDLDSSTHIILPGQGAFKSCMIGLTNSHGMIDRLTENVLNKKKPFLGICVGMQLLANSSCENGDHAGLGWIEGEIKKIPNNNLKLPHMGWNNLELVKKNRLIQESNNNNNYYFVHSYYFSCRLKENEFGLTNYGLNFTSFVSKENIYGVQFHPEKSSNQGLKLLENFVNI